MLGVPLHSVLLYKVLYYRFQVWVKFAKTRERDRQRRNKEVVSQDKWFTYISELSLPDEK